MDLVQQRDGSGRFAGEIKPDAELAGKWSEDDRRANLAAAVMDRIRLPKDLAGLVKKGGRLGGGQWLGAESRAALLGVAFGIAYATVAETRTEVAQTLHDTFDVLGIKERVFRILDEKKADT
jgi:hypothetical protein